jgi:hypothetical protein
VPEPEAIYSLSCFLQLMLKDLLQNPIAILFDELPENKHPAFWPNAMLFDPDVL